MTVASDLASEWRDVHPNVNLTIERSTPPRNQFESAAQYTRSGDIVANEGDGGELGGYAEYVDLLPWLRQANFDISHISAAAVQAFTFGDHLFGLPLWVDPFAVLVNDAYLAELGVNHAPNQVWTLGEVERAVQTALAQRQGGTPAQLIAGQVWTDIRIWGSFVIGLGGRLTSGNGGLDFSGTECRSATARLLALATASGWSPTGSGVGYEAAIQGFVGSAANTLFSIQPAGVGGSRKPSFNRFPMFPDNPLIPAATTVGLCVSKFSRHLDVATAFMLWLYEPAQQKLLVDAGLPPVINDPDLWRAFSMSKSGTVNWAGVYDPHYVTDLLAHLPGTGSVGWLDYDAVLTPALEQAARDPGNVAQYLQQAQDQLQQRIVQAAEGARVG